LSDSHGSSGSLQFLLNPNVVPKVRANESHKVLASLIEQSPRRNTLSFFIERFFELGPHFLVVARCIREPRLEQGDHIGRLLASRLESVDAVKRFGNPLLGGFGAV
jgi:hypothetical protein